MPPGTASKPWPHHGHQGYKYDDEGTSGKGDEKQKLSIKARMKNKIKSSRFKTGSVPHAPQPGPSAPPPDDVEDMSPEDSDSSHSHKAAKHKFKQDQGHLKKYDPRRLKRGVNEGKPSAGYLYLWVGNFRRWQRRFFIAHTPGVLVFYKRSHCKGPNWTINLSEANVIVNDSHPRQFVIVSGSILYYLRTILPDFRAPWVKCVNNSISTFKTAVTKAAGIAPETVQKQSPKNADPKSPPVASLPAETLIAQAKQKTQVVNNRLNEAMSAVKSKEEAFTAELAKIQHSLQILTNSLGLSPEASGVSTRSRSISSDGGASDRGESGGALSLLGQAWEELQKEYKTLLEEEVTRTVELEVENDGLHHIIKDNVKARKMSNRKNSLRGSLNLGSPKPSVSDLDEVVSVVSVNDLSSELSEADDSDESDTNAPSIHSMKVVEAAVSKDMGSSLGADDEYFEALEIVHQHEYIVQSAPSCESPGGSPPEESEEKGKIAPGEEDEFSDDEEEEEEDEEEQELFKPRTRLPHPAPLNANIDLWFIVKQALGRDLNTITLPSAPFFEPLGLLQRGAEELEYIELLHVALKKEKSIERLMHMAIFILSAYPAGQVRVKKPFNSLQGETYEWVKDDHCQLLTEQVSHYPPITAFDCTSLDPKLPYHLYGEQEFKNKFWGKTAEITPQGSFQLHDELHNEHYSWNKTKIKLSNIIIGTPWSDINGDITLRNHTTGEVAKITIKKARNKDHVGNVAGVVYDAYHNPCYHISGNHMKGIYVDVDSSMQGQVPEPAKRLMFMPTPMPLDYDKQYHMTQHAFTLNEMTAKQQRELPPTDSRRRPDQLKLEQGFVQDSTVEKFRLEQKELKEMKELKASGQMHNPPVWFTRQDGVNTDRPFFSVKQHDPSGQSFDGSVVFKFNDKYWPARESNRRGEHDWEQCPTVFD